MDLSLTETQVMLRRMATEFLEQELPKERVREIDESETGFSPPLWRQMAELRWPGMVIPEEYGGTANSLTDLGVVYEALGYAACTSPLLSSGVLSAHILLEIGDDAQKQELLPAIARGGHILAFAFTEPDYGWGPESVQLTATRREDCFLLSGAKLFVPDAHIADQLLVAARTAQGADPQQGLSIFLVPGNAPGLSVRLQSGWIGDKVCEVTLRDVEVPASAVIGPVGEVWPAIERVLDRATALLCAYMVGGSQKALDMAVEYSKNRIAFGVPIGTFQRVQDRIIDALNDTEAARWTAYEALWKLDEIRADAPLAVSTAKAVVSDGFPRVCDNSHHVHGGIGTDLAFGLTHYTKRARTFQHYLGDAIHHKRRLARLLEL
jgi:alkylation response protein AidB-like acyl-CoA dehydrogenase